MPNLSFSHFAANLRRAHAANPRRFRLAFLGVLAVALAFASVKYAAKVNKPGDTGQQTRSAFLRWRAMIRDAFTGTNIYVGKNEYPNPPVMAVILRPFAGLPPVVGAMTWFYAKVLMAVLAAVWAFRLAEFRGGDRETRRGGESPNPSPDSLSPCLPVSLSPPLPLTTDVARAAAVLLALPALMGDLTHNNVNIFILFLLAGCLELYRRGRDAGSGLVLGLAIACKVTPALFLAFFVWKRAWRTVAGCAAGLVLALAVVPGLAFGWDHNIELHTDWYKLMVERPVLKGEVTSEHPNQAVVGVVYRLLTDSPSFVGYKTTPAGDIPYPAAFHNLCDIGRPAAWWVVKGFTAAFALAVVLLCWTPRAERQGWRFAAECGLIVMGMLLLSERTWKHHGTVLLIPAAALAFAATLDLPRRVRQFVVGALLAAALLMATPGLFGTRVADLALVYGTHFAAFLLLTAALGAVLACAGRERGHLGRS